MKLRLPHKFQTALMAALASVSFTTLSSGTLAVATGAALLAGQQAQAVDYVTDPTAQNAAGWIFHDLTNNTWVYSDNYGGNPAEALASTFFFYEEGSETEKINFKNNAYAANRVTYTFALTVDLSRLEADASASIMFAASGFTGVGITPTRNLTETWVDNAQYKGWTFAQLGTTGCATIVLTEGNNGGYLSAYNADGTVLQARNGTKDLKGTSSTVNNFIISDALKAAVVSVAVWQTDNTLGATEMQHAAGALADLAPYHGMHFSGDIFTFEDTGTHDFHSATFSNWYFNGIEWVSSKDDSHTWSGTGNTYYEGTTAKNLSGSNSYFWRRMFGDANGGVATLLGNTIRLANAASNTYYKATFGPMQLGGVIAEAGDYTYVVGRTDGSSDVLIKARAGEEANMYIASNVGISSGSDTSKGMYIDSSGTWHVEPGKTLTLALFNSTSNFSSIANAPKINFRNSGAVNMEGGGTIDLHNTNALIIDAGSSINIAAGTTLKLAANTSLSGSIANAGNLELAGLTMNDGSSLVNSGNMTLGATINMTGGTLELRAAEYMLSGVSYTRTEKLSETTRGYAEAVDEVKLVDKTAGTLTIGTGATFKYRPAGRETTLTATEVDENGVLHYTLDRDMTTYVLTNNTSVDLISEWSGNEDLKAVRVHEGSGTIQVSEAFLPIMGRTFGLQVEAGATAVITGDEGTETGLELNGESTFGADAHVQVSKEIRLDLAHADSAAAVLKAATGTGGIGLLVNTTLANGTTTAAAGTLTLGSGTTHSLGSGDSHVVNLGSFSQVVFDNAAIISNAAASTLQNVTVNTNKSGTLLSIDMDTNTYVLAGTTSVAQGGTFTLANYWNAQFRVNALVGDGTFKARGNANNSSVSLQTNSNEGMELTIDSLSSGNQSFSGDLIIDHVSGSTSKKDSFIINTGSQAVTFRSLQVNYNESRAQAPLALNLGADATIGEMTLTGGPVNVTGEHLLTVGGVNGAADLTVAGDLAINVEQGGTHSDSGSLNVAGELTKSGEGSQSFGGNASSSIGSLAVNGGTLSFTGTGGVATTGLSGTGTLNVTGSLTVTNADSAAYTGTLTLGGLVKDGAAALQLGGTTNLHGAVAVNAGSLTIAGGTGATPTVTFGGTITNSATLTLSGLATVGGDVSSSYGVFKEGTGYTYSGKGQYKGSGYIAGTDAQYYLVRGTGTLDAAGLTLSNAERVEGDGIGANDYVFQLNPSEEPISTDVYYVNSDLAYDDGEMGLALKLSIKDGVTLTAAADAPEGNKTLIGSGTYALTSNTITLPSHVSLGTAGEWTGAVRVSNYGSSSTCLDSGIRALNLPEGSRVDLNGVNGYFNGTDAGLQVQQNIVLTNTANGGAAVEVTNGNSGKKVVFTGTWSGEGDFLHSWGNSGSNGDQTYSFQGNISAWEGSFTAGVNASGQGKGNITLEILGAAQTVNADIRNERPTTMTLNITNSNAVTVNGNIIRSNGTLDVNVAANTTFTGELVGLSKMTVGSDFTATIQNTAEIGTLSGAGNVAVGTTAAGAATGTLSLAGSDTFTGNVTVNSGSTLSLLQANSLVTTGALTFESGSTLDLSHYHGTLSSTPVTVATASTISGFGTSMYIAPTAPGGMQASVTLGGTDNNEIQVSYDVKDGAAMRLYILTGQSNSLGAVKGKPLPADLIAAYQTEALLWNGNMHKNRPAGADTNRYIENPDWQFVAPQEPGLTMDASTYAGNPCMGPEYGFSYILEKKGWTSLLGANDTLAVVKGSLDGGGNSYWLRDDNAYQTLLDNVKLSIQDAVTMGYKNIQLEGLMYLQGESNNDAETAVADTRFADFLSYLTEDLNTWLATDGAPKGVTVTFADNAVTGENFSKPAVSQKFLDAATKDGKVNADDNGRGFVFTKDLEGIGDGLHFAGNSQLTIGARYAYAFAVQNGVNVGAVRGQDDSKNLNDAGAWWMEKLPGETEVATWDISSVSTVNNIEDGQTLTVGGIMIDEVYNATATAKGQGSITINGGAISLGADGINLVGGSLTANSAVTVRATQTWQAADGLRLAVNGTTTIGDGATLTLKDGLYLTFGAITGTGNLEIGQVTFDMNMDYMLANGLGKYSSTDTLDGENGYFNGKLDLVRLTGTGSAITFTGDGSVEKNINKAGELANYTLALTNDGKALSVSGLTPETETYYARSGQVEYTSNDTGDYGIYKASTVMLAGSVEAPATLKLASELKEGTVIVTSGIGGSISIDSGVSLAASSVNAAAAPAAITGAGEYVANTISGVTGRSFTLAEAFGANVTLASDWSGSVVLSGGDTSFSKYTGLGNYDSFYSGHEVEGVMQYSTIVFNGLNAYLDHAKNTTATINANIEMRGTEDGGTGTALLLTAGNTTTTVFTGKVSGAGNLVFDKNSGSAEAIKFTGDIAGWEGSITTGTHSNGPLNLTLGGSVTNVNAAITRPDGSNHSINVTVDATNAVSFNKAVTGVSSFIIAEGKAATLAGTDAHSISNLTVNSGSSFTVANGATAAVTGAVLKNTISNDGTFTLGGTVNLDALTAQVSTEIYGSAEVATAGNGFLTAHKEVRVFNEGHVSSLTMADGVAVSYNGLTGTIHTDDGVFYSNDTPTLSTFYVRIADSAEDYSTAHVAATTSLTTVSLANATTINMNEANATLGTLTLAVGDAGAATMKATANATVSAITGLAAGQTLHFTGDSASPAVLTINGNNTANVTGNLDITGVTVKLGSYMALGAYNGRGATAATRTITVGEGGVLDMNGAETGADHGYKITLAGGTLTNTGTARKWSNRQPFTNVVLASDSKAVATADFGIMASSWNETTLDLQDRVLEVSGAGRFYLSNTTVNAGENGLGTILAKGGTVNFNGNRADAGQQGSFAGNLKMAADDNGTAGTIAGRLKLGGTTKVSSTVEGDNPAVVTADINTNGHTLRFEGAQDINVAPGTATGDDYNGRAAISGNGTIEHASTGTTTFSGSMANFTGSVDVEKGTLNIMNIAQASSLNVKDVTIAADATMGVYTNGTAAEANEGTLTMKAGNTLKAGGENATLNANLVMEAGSVLEVSLAQATHGLTMGSTVALNTGDLLGDADLGFVQNLKFGEYYYLYNDVESLSVNGTQYDSLNFKDWTDFDMDASVVYNTQLDEKRYALVYSWNGSNVGTIAITLIPEPTTSTLSLLALCALAARRRRK